MSEPRKAVERMRSAHEIMALVEKFVSLQKMAQKRGDKKSAAEFEHFAAGLKFCALNTFETFPNWSELHVLAYILPTLSLDCMAEIWMP